MASDPPSRAGREPAVGVVTGLRAEARCLRELRVRIACSGGSPERARGEAARLLAEGAAGLVSFGLAGGLTLDLRSGDLLLPDTVLSPEGLTVPTDPGWRARLGSLLEKGGLSTKGGTLVGSERVVATADDKRMLRETTGALAADMESHAVAAVAIGAGVPFAVVRAVADPYDRVIPQAALEALRPDGRVRALATLGGVIRQPVQLLALLRLGHDAAAALATLRRAAALCAPDLGFDQES